MMPAALALCVSAAVGQEEIDRTIPSSGRGSVEIVNTSGRVRVIGWNRSEIRITGRLGRGTERLEVEGGRDQTQIRVVIPRSSRDVRGSDLEIQLPAGKSVTVRTVSADIDVQGVGGALSASSTSGDVKAAGSPRQVAVNSTSGDVSVRVNTRSVRASTTSGDLSVAGTVAQTVAAESVSGDVQIAAQTPELVAKTVSGDLDVSSVGRRATASTVSGDASIRGSRMQYVSFESVSGNLRFEGDVQQGAAFKVESHSGDVELVLPAGVAADFQISSFSGDILNELGPQARQTGPYTPAKELRFSTGRGGLVAVRTFSGTVKLRKR